MAYLTSLRLYQVGIQSAFGTAVAATAKLLVEDITFRPIDVMHRPNLAKGLAIAMVGNEFATRRGIEFTARGPLSYEQFQTWLLAGMNGSVTASGDPDVWTFTRNATSIYTPGYLTIEVRFSDGTTPDDFEVADCVVSNYRVFRGADERLEFEITGFGRRVQDSTLTSSQSLPTPTHIPYALSTVDRDSTWANLGTTNLATAVLDWSWEHNTGLYPIYTADGRSDLDFSAVGYNPNAVTNNVTMTLRGSSTFATEKTAAEAATLRAVQIVTTNSASATLTINGLYKHAAGSLMEMGTQDGEDVFSVNLVKSTDDTNFMSVLLTNNTDAPDGVA